VTQVADKFVGLANIDDGQLVGALRRGRELGHVYPAAVRVALRSHTSDAATYLLYE